ncbi:MAG: FKBP-type peptidyl-prolyl cis-trans isomerase [Gammaproteobacteria bacterium]|nr:FKBP-type peptidyl-prolyl cis-trans isomerase [Gammaproteobacteria bacterium]
MKRLLVLPLLLVGSQLSLAADSALKTDISKESYSIGYDFGKNISKRLADVEMKTFINGFEDAFQGTASKLTQDEMMAAMQSYRQKMMVKQQAERAGKSEENKAASVKFLTENKKQKGVMTLASGMQYTVLADGTGKTPTASDTVTVHYRGTLANGEEFDSSYRRKEPATFPVSGVIKGWTEALQLMKEGGKWQLFIPPELAYGEQGAGASIGPNEVLIFEVELIEVKSSS